MPPFTETLNAEFDRPQEPTMGQQIAERANRGATMHETAKAIDDAVAFAIRETAQRCADFARVERDNPRNDLGMTTMASLIYCKIMAAKEGQ